MIDVVSPSAALGAARGPLGAALDPGARFRLPGTARRQQLKGVLGERKRGPVW
jgi:hypothetical protein